MGSFSLFHWIVVLLVILVFFWPGQDLRDDGRFRQGHPQLQEGHGGG